MADFWNLMQSRHFFAQKNWTFWLRSSAPYCVALCICSHAYIHTYTCKYVYNISSLDICGALLFYVIWSSYILHPCNLKESNFQPFVIIHVTSILFPFFIKNIKRLSFHVSWCWIHLASSVWFSLIEAEVDEDPRSRFLKLTGSLGCEWGWILVHGQMRLGAFKVVWP